MTIPPLQDIATLYGYPVEDFTEDVAQAVRQGRARREAKRILAEEENPPQTPPEIVDLATRMERPRTPTVFRVAGWQPCEGRVIIAAQAKAGKTHATHNLVRCLVDGDRWLGRWKVRRITGNVVILDVELSETTAEDWLMKQGIQHTDQILLCALRGRAASFNILDPGTRAAWAQLLAEKNTDYLILDCLRPILDALGLDEHKDAGKFLNAFDALLKEAGIPEAAIVHHMGHGGERARGDSRIIDWPDATWKMTLDNIVDQSSDRYITAFGRDVEIGEHKLELTRTTGHLRAVATERDDAETEQAILAVLSVLREYGEPLSGRAIEHVLREHDVGRQAVRTALRLGVRRGNIEPMTGAHNATLYTLPSSWVRKVSGGVGDDDYTIHEGGQAHGA